MKKHLLKKIMTVLLFIAPFFGAIKAQQLAFPGAEGFGKYAVGGRAGTVVHVTNLNDAGAGSLRDAVSASNRIVVFDVAGVIKISARIVVSPNIYIAGQTAPGEGITVYGNGWSFSGANNSICRYIKIRMGIVGSSGDDANGIANGHDMIFDHCSISWGRDETFSINAPTTARVTIQNCIMSQGLLTHSAGGLIQNDSGITLYRNLYADNGTRNNKIKGRNQYVNNIVYNWSAGAYIMGGDSEGESFVNAVSNLFIQGPIPGVSPFSVGNSLFHIYQTDNLSDSNHNGIFDPHVIQQSEFGGGPDFQATPYPYPILPTIAANTLLDQSLPTVGACLPYRDFVDYYVVNEVKSLGLKGQFIGNETALPFGVPTAWYLWPGTKRTDTDNDGIPDDWETAHGLNPNSAADAMIITANGYTNIENFINGIDSTYSQAYLRTPLNLVMDSATQSTVSLSWYDYTDKEQGYIVEKKINGVFTQVGQTGVNGNTFTNTGMQPEESDTFRVKAFNAGGFSGYSNELVAKSKPTPVAVLDPTTFAPDLVWTGSVNQNWDKVTANWTHNGSPANFTDSSKLKFGTIASNQTINLTAQMGAKDILVQSDQDYILQGSGYIAGSASINKYGNGKLSLLTNNTYTGGTIMGGGTMEINKIAYGGLPSSIGASQGYPFNWVWKGGVINYTGGKTATDRSVSLDATTEFSIASATAADTMYGVISGGGSLIKSGLGNLVLRSANTYEGETVIKKGTIEVTPISTATDAQNIIINGVALGTSNVLRLQGGTFKTSGGSTVANENYPMHIYVEGTDTSGLAPYRNANLNGDVSGSGTLLYTIPYLREIIQGDWSEFTGTLIAFGSNTTDGSILMINNDGSGNGIPNARIVATGNTKICTYSNNLTVSLGGLSSDVTGVKLSCGGTKTSTFGFGQTTYSVGGANTDETFRGVINNELYGSTTDDNTTGSATIIKEGFGLWRLTNTNTYSGTTTIVGGKLIVNGSHTGAGAYTVTTGTLAGKGSIAADVDVADTLQPGDSSANKFTLKGKLTLESGSTTQVDINKSNSTKDTIAVTGAITYGGTLQVNFTGTPAEGDVFKLFTIGSTQSGNFSAIVPATPGTGLQWLFKPSTGELLVVSPGFVQPPSNLAVSATSDINTNTSKINLTWTDNSDNELYFILERSTDGTNFTDINHPVANATSYQDINLVPNTIYYYRIKAIGSTKVSAYSNIASIKTPSIFSAPDLVSNPSPTNAAVDVPLTGGNLNLTWSGSNNTVTYSVYFGTVAGSLTKLIDLPYSANPSYQVTGLNSYSTYYWRIDATNATGTTTGTQWSFRTAEPGPIAGDYRSNVTTGDWSTVATWQVYDASQGWIAATTIPTSSANITIRTGHTISLKATTQVSNVMIEPTGNLKSDGTNRTLRVSKGVTSYGVFGGTGTSGDRINLESYLDNGTIIYSGTGTFYVNTFNVNPMALTENIIIDANMNVNSYFRAYYSDGTTLNQSDDSVTVTINQGRTVTFTSSGYLSEASSGNTLTTNTITTFGSYTYNINGTLDMHSNTTTSSVVAHSTIATSHIVFNVNGTWLTGNAIRLVANLTSGLPAGSIAFNIGDKGVVDAKKDGTTNTNIVMSNSSNGQILFWNITGGGVLKYRVGNADVSYPVGSGGTYNPVILNNSGTADIIAVGVKSNFDNALNMPNKVVNKQFTITPATVGAANLTISLGWLTGDQSTGFTTNSDVIGHFGGTVWDETPATISGAGTMANPYYAKASGFTSFSPFGVGNANAFVKLAPTAFTGCPNINLVVARRGYNTYNNEPLSFYNLDTATGAATIIPGGPLMDQAQGKNIELNGAGVNGQDGFVYGIRDTINTAGTAQAAMFYRAGGNYASDMLGNLAAPGLLGGENLAVVNPSAGGFDDQGNYYYIAMAGAYSFTSKTFTPSSYYVGTLTGVATMAAGTGTLTPTWTKIDFTTAPASYKSSLYNAISSSSGTGAATSFQDITYSNLYKSLYVYAAYNTGQAYSGQLFAINPSSGVTTFYANPPAFGAVNNEVAGISTTASGNLRVLLTNGDIYKPVMSGIDFTSTFTKVGTSGITGGLRGDLASCGVGSSTLPNVRTSSIATGLPSGITAYPNPAQGLTTITVGQRLLNATVKLLDIAGNVIAEKSGVAGYTFQMDMTGKAGGLYTIQVTQGGNTQTVKVMKP